MIYGVLKKFSTTDENVSYIVSNIMFAIRLKTIHIFAYHALQRIYWN